METKREAITYLGPHGGTRDLGDWMLKYFRGTENIKETGLSSSAQVSETACHRPVAETADVCFCPALDAGSLRSGCQQGKVPERPLFLLTSGDFSVCLHMADRKRAGSLVFLLIKVLIPSEGPYPHLNLLTSESPFSK